MCQIEVFCSSEKLKNEPLSGISFFSSSQIEHSMTRVEYLLPYFGLCVIEHSFRKRARDHFPGFTNFFSRERPQTRKEFVRPQIMQMHGILPRPNYANFRVKKRKFNFPPTSNRERGFFASYSLETLSSIESA